MFPDSITQRPPLISLVRIMSETTFTVSSSIPAGKSWADQADSPGWAARSPPKFSEEMPDIVLDEEEYDRLPASASASGPFSVFVGGLDYSLEAKDIEEFFSSKGVRVNRVRVQKQNGRSMGRAFLNVADKAALDSVLKLTGSTLSGRQITLKEDVAPRPARTSSSKSDRQSKIGGRWREEEKSKSKKDNSWQAVGKGGKIVEPPRDDRRKRQTEKRDGAATEEKSAADDVPKERKRLELKPRSKPIGEEESLSRSSSIFGSAKPRDEFEYQKRKSEVDVVENRETKVDVEKSEPVRRKERREAKPVPQVIIPEPVKTVKKKAVNRFAVDSSSESDDE